MKLSRFVLVATNIRYKKEPSFLKRLFNRIELPREWKSSPQGTKSKAGKQYPPNYAHKLDEVYSVESYDSEIIRVRGD